MKKLFSLKITNSVFLIILTSLAILLCSTVILVLSFYPLPSQKQFPEIAYLKDKPLDFNQLKSYFQNLASQKGAPYAYEVLKRAPMPPNIDMHLLGHVVGEILYLQKGADGMAYCTQDFRNACSHTIVVGLFLDKGEAAIKEINSACKKAPGGSGAYLMCHHGLGHGVLAYTSYDLGKTVLLCEKFGTQEKNYQEFPECVGGAIMETISGGDHDPQTWALKRQTNLKAEDPLYPCDAEIIPKEAKKLCYLYLTPNLFNLAGENPGGKPTDQAISKAFTFCEKLPESEGSNRDVCFGGFGKEFVVLAKDRDIRRVENMTDDELRKVINWCGLTSNKPAQNSCLKYAVGSLFWGGENKRTIALNFCNLILAKENKSACFRSLTSNIRVYIKDKNYRREYCDETPPDFKDYCQKTLL